VSRETLRSAALVLAPVLLLCGLFAACFERRTEEVPVGYSREALTNPYLALERLLARMGHEVVSLEGLGELDALPPTDGFLLIPTRRDTLSAERSRSLLEWVERGGHLLVVTYSMWDEDDRRPDPLLDGFGFQQHWGQPPEEPESDEAVADEQPPNEEAEDPTGEEQPQVATEVDVEVLATLFGAFSGAPSEWDVARLAWPGRDEPLELNFDPRYRWVDGEGRAELTAAGTAGAHLLVARHGEGWLTALTDDWLLRNDHVGEADHAELWARLARRGREGPVWIVTSTRWPGLLRRAVEHALPALAGLGVLLAAWLWRVSRRFGPIRPAPPPARRRWFDHLEAAGRYHWHEGNGRALLQSTRECVLRELARRRPQLVGLAPAKRDARLAELAQLRSEEVARALTDAPRPREEFTATMAHLERIRASL
jgi:hypothetical protein